MHYPFERVVCTGLKRWSTVTSNPKNTTIEKKAQYVTASRLLIGKIRLPKVKYPKFEGHVMPNEDEYQKYVRLKFRYCLGVS